MSASHHSYEDMASAPPAYFPDLLEAFSGADIVRWAGAIKYRLIRMADDQDKNRNAEYAQLIRNFLNTWEANPITGSINRETLEILKAAASPLSVMKWPPASYFAGVSTSLDQLIADQEQLPTGVPPDNSSPMSGGMGGGAPLGDEFGPQENPPGGPAAPGAEGAPSADQGMQPDGQETGAPGKKPKPGAPPL